MKCILADVNLFQREKNIYGWKKSKAKKKKKKKGKIRKFCLRTKFQGQFWVSYKFMIR